MYSFRIRVHLSAKNSFVQHGNTSRLDLIDTRFPQVVFCFKNPDDPDTQSRRGSLVVEGSGYPAEVDATEGGTWMRSTLMAAFARSHMAADFGDRAGRGVLTRHGRRMFEEQAGRPALNESHGDVVVFKTEPRPVFVRVGPAHLSRGHKPDFGDHLKLFAATKVGRSERIESSYDSNSAAFFTANPDVRLVRLVTAVEYLITREPRGVVETDFITDVISDANTLGLDDTARDRLIGGLRDLKKESISQAGQRLIGELMSDDLQIGGKQAQDLFKKAYGIRSKIVHGVTPRPTRNEVGLVGANMEIMVGDLIAEACLACWQE